MQLAIAITSEKKIETTKLAVAGTKTADNCIIGWPKLAENWDSYLTLIDTESSTNVQFRLLKLVKTGRSHPH